MPYVEVEIEGIGTAYQEVNGGHVLRYLDSKGDELFTEIPIGVGSAVTDAKPINKAWMTSLDDGAIGVPDSIKQRVFEAATLEELTAEVQKKSG